MTMKYFWRALALVYIAFCVVCLMAAIVVSAT
jgi:hypothetical protein